MFTIKAWENKEHSEKDGLYGTTQRVKDAIEAAKILFNSNDSVEILNGDKVIYKIMHDPKNPDKPIVKDMRDPTLIPSELEEEEDSQLNVGMRFEI
jgi:hypothetical protein